MEKGESAGVDFLLRRESEFFQNKIYLKGLFVQKVDSETKISSNKVTIVLVLDVSLLLTDFRVILYNFCL